MPEVRIQKALADAGVASRRAADTLVESGRVRINGRPAVVGERVDPDADTIEVDGRRLGRVSRQLYLCLSKPAGVTSTVADRHARRTVLDLVPADLLREAGRLYPVGRLDEDSEGLLLLTNDGRWADRVLHPRYGVEREYAVGLREPLEGRRVRQLESGVLLDEGLARLRSLRPATEADVRKLEGLVGPSRPSLAWYRATLTQGWRRQLRRMFAAVGAPVERLVRVRIGPLRLDRLHPGDVRELTARERAGLEAGAGPRGRAAHGLTVTLDGPSSSGKSTVGAGAAARLGYRFCDTGLLYRALTWLALERGVSLSDGPRLVELVPAIALATDAQERFRLVRVGERDVTQEVRSPHVDRHVSEVARQPEVREVLLPVQRSLAEGGRIIMAGRDIGSVVLPDADLKLYLDVSLDERARRRAIERGLDPEGPDAERIGQELRQRDRIDSSREASPLRVPDGATVIRSDGNMLEDTIRAVVAAVEERARRLASEA